jgi:transcriptional regulator with XRE-family HTH domain
MADITPSRIRKIRKALGMSQHDFARVVWVTYSTLSRWELGYAAPFGLHLRILMQLEKQLPRPSFKKTLRDPRANDPLFLLYRLLKPRYAARKSTLIVRSLHDPQDRRLPGELDDRTVCSEK